MTSGSGMGIEEEETGGTEAEVVTHGGMTEAMGVKPQLVVICTEEL